ncbi:MFS transporter [Lysobacter sp. 2RAF19]
MSDARLDPYRFKPEEYPIVPGGPYTPWHPVSRRVAYAALGVGIGVLGSLGNALVNVNVNALAGGIGRDTVQANWLVAVAVAANASANLMLIRARFRFGVPAITRAVILFYAAMALLQFAFPGYTAAIAIRFASGMAAAGLTTLALYSLLQAMPANMRPSALAMAIVLPQLATPIARLFPVELLAQDAWHGLHLIELGSACLCLVLSSVLPLPPTDRKPGLERLDYVTIAVLVPAIFCLCGVLGLGRVVWWTDTPWLGWMLVAFVALLTVVVLLERSRAQPLLYMAWLGSREILRFAAVAVLVRLALAEQTYGAVGLLTSGGLTNDQLRILFLWVLAAMVLGMLTAGFTLSMSRLPYQVMIAAWIIALGAWLDSDASNLTRPEQLYFSQALIGFGTSLFVGPALVFGFTRMLGARRPDLFVSIIVLFSLTQNVGGLAGSAMLGTIQQYETRAHAQALSERLVASDPQVAARLQGGASALAPSVIDPNLRIARGGALLTQALNREAAVLAYDVVFKVVAFLGGATGLYVAYLIALRARRERLAALASTT